MNSPRNMMLLCLTLPAPASAEVAFQLQPPEPAFRLTMDSRDCSGLSNTERMLCQSGKASGDECHALQNAHARNQCLLSMSDNPIAATSSRERSHAVAPKAQALLASPDHPGDLPAKTELEARLLPPAP